MFRGKYGPVYDHPATRKRSRRWLLTATTPIVHRDGKYSRRHTSAADDGPWRRLRPLSTRAQQTMAPDGDYAHHLPPLRTTAERCMLWKPGEEGRTTHTWFVCRTPKNFLKNLVAEIYIRGVPALRSIKFNFKNYAVYIREKYVHSITEKMHVTVHVIQGTIISQKFSIYNFPNVSADHFWDTGISHYCNHQLAYFQIAKCLRKQFLRHWNTKINYSQILGVSGDISQTQEFDLRWGQRPLGTSHWKQVMCNHIYITWCDPALLTS